jgi:hypothetical protein
LTIQLYYWCLDRAARLLETRPLNWISFLARQFYLFTLIPALRYRLKKSFPKADLFIRGSLRTSSGFNLFFSDLDIGIQSEDRFEEIAAWFASARKWIPSLGEVEIYTSTELVLLRQVLARRGDEHRFIRNIRKIGWKEQELQTAQTDYHRNKCLRSMRKCSRELGVPFGESAARSLQLESALNHFFYSRSYVYPVDFDRQVARIQRYRLFCPYLGQEIGSTEDAKMRLSPTVGMLLLAVTPPAQRRRPKFDEFIDKIRSASLKINACYRDLEIIERLEFQGSRRGLPAPKLEAWMNDYMTWIGVQSG